MIFYFDEFFLLFFPLFFRGMIKVTLHCLFGVLEFGLWPNKLISEHLHSGLYSADGLKLDAKLTCVTERILSTDCITRYALSLWRGQGKAWQGFPSWISVHRV